MTSGFFSGDVLRGLAVRVLFFLSLAMLPIGLIAISQTQRITEQNRVNAELSLIAVTEQSSTAERVMLERALGAAEALASIIGLLHQDKEECEAFFRAYRAANDSYRLVGFVGTDGVMSCSSSDQIHDYSGEPMFALALADPRPRAQLMHDGTLSGVPVINVSTPVLWDGDLRGFVVISIVHQAFEVMVEPDAAFTPLALMTFNQEGQILTAEGGMDGAIPELPADLNLLDFTGRKSAVFVATNQSNVRRLYALRPIVGDVVFAISVWPLDTPFVNPPLVTRLWALLPILMWAASLVVAFWALNKLAIRHIRKLGRQMRLFALNRTLPRPQMDAGVPTELVEIERAFVGMGESILRDEATLEDSLRQKNILLKEVHHRVKNNLQLISSIMNMQIRQAQSEDARLVLLRLQERILSLATVHKNLYQDDSLVQVAAADLLREVVSQLLSVGLAAGSNVEVVQTYAPINLDADDAAPLTLLVSEAVTNALKHVPQDGSGEAVISVVLAPADDDQATLRIFNTKGGVPSQEGTGLGKRLIDAFARQLNGQVEVHETDLSFEMVITFPIPQGPKAVYDY